MNKLISRIALALLVASVTSLAQAAGPCAHCGCQANCQKVCRLVVEEKKVAVTCWGCECEDFCLPGPSCRGDKNVACVCADCDKDGPVSQPKKFVWYDWIPNPCAQVHTKKKLMKKTVNKTVPSYKWVVEDLCSDCEQKCVGAPLTPGAEVPAPPVAGATLKYR